MVQEIKVVSDLGRQEGESGEHEEAWRRIRSADGILVPGGFGSRGVEGKILAAKYAREHNVPYLGICLGMQVRRTPALLCTHPVTRPHFASLQDIVNDYWQPRSVQEVLHCPQRVEHSRRRCADTLRALHNAIWPRTACGTMPIGMTSSSNQTLDVCDVLVQTAVIEFARNVLGLADANSAEFEAATPNPVVVFMPEGSTTHKGGTMRLGSRKTILQTMDCITARLYQAWPLGAHCDYQFGVHFLAQGGALCQSSELGSTLAESILVFGLFV